MSICLIESVNAQSQIFLGGLYSVRGVKQLHNHNICLEKSHCNKWNYLDGVNKSRF